MRFKRIAILDKLKRYKGVVIRQEKILKKLKEVPDFYFALAYNAYFINEYEKCVKALTEYQRLKPHDLYGVLWRFNALRHLKLVPEKDLAIFAESLSTQRWPRPVVDFYCGEISLEECLAKAVSENPKQDNDMKCEAYFYIGEQLFLGGKTSRASAYFKKCLACGIEGGLETKCATIRLNRARGD